MKNLAKPEKNRAKTEKTESNQFEPVFVLKNESNRTETGRFEPVSVRFRFFFLKISLVTFFYKNQTKLKMITPKQLHHRSYCGGKNPIPRAGFSQTRKLVGIYQKFITLFITPLQTFEDLRTCNKISQGIYQK